MKKHTNLDYNYLIGKGKDNILRELGDAFNFYPEDIWYYNIKKNWLGKKTTLLIKFKGNIVEKTDVIRHYGSLENMQDT